MKAKKLMRKLERLVEEHGNLPVFIYSNEKIKAVAAYDANGNTEFPRTEIILHFNDN